MLVEGMRWRRLSWLAVLLVAAACGQSEGTIGSEVSEVNDYGACSLSRKTILDATSPLRQAAIARGFAWLDARVPYNQAGSHEGYRTDCSGFVSMCWDIGGPGPNTTLFESGAGKARVLGSYDDLLPADALLRSGHVMIFVAWNDRARSEACVLEQTNTRTDMKFRVRKTAALRAEGYRGLRADKLAKDLGTAAPKPEPSTAPKPEPSTAPKPDASTAPKPDASTAPKPDASTAPVVEEEEEAEETTTADRVDARSNEGDPGDEPEDEEPTTDDPAETASTGCAAGRSSAPGGLALGGLLALAAGVARRRRARRPRA